VGCAVPQGDAVKNTFYADNSVYDDVWRRAYPVIVSLGAQENLEITQAAYDRYMAR
jgi:hypothetical protein